MRNDKKPAPVNATDCPAQIVMIVTSAKGSGRYRAYVEGHQEALCVSRQPFFDGARKLLARGRDSRTVLLMRWKGDQEWTLRGPLGVAAELTVDEHNGTVFAKWKPLPRSAGSPKIAKSADKLSQGPHAERALLESTAEGAGERTRTAGARHCAYSSR